MMAQLRFALLRHGVTQWNAQKRIQGHSDIALLPETQTRLSSLQLPDFWADVPWFSSPLLRCRQTAMALGIADPILAPAWIEMDWGRWEGRHLADLRAELGDAMRLNEDRGRDFRPDGGESPRDVTERVTAWLHDVHNHHDWPHAQPGQPGHSGHPDTDDADMPVMPSFGVVTHKGVIRAIHAMACGWDMLGKCPDRLDWNAMHVFCWSPQTGFAIDRLNVPLIARGDG